MGIHVIEGKVVGQEMKVGIVAARFNEFIVSKLLSGAVDGLVRHGVEEDAITAVWVPGAFEIPLMAEKMAQSGKYDAVICVGAVIRGSTSHYDYVCSEVSKGYRICQSEDGSAGIVRCCDNREYRAGNRTCRDKSRQ